MDVRIDGTVSKSVISIQHYCGGRTSALVCRNRECGDVFSLVADQCRMSFCFFERSYQTTQQTCSTANSFQQPLLSWLSSLNSKQKQSSRNPGFVTSACIHVYDQIWNVFDDLIIHHIFFFFYETIIDIFGNLLREFEYLNWM